MVNIKAVDFLRAYKYKVYIPYTPRESYGKSELAKNERYLARLAKKKPDTSYALTDFDPDQNFGETTVGFSKITGLNFGSNEVMTYRTGTDKLLFQKESGLLTFQNVIFERGMASESDAEQIQRWREDVMFNMDTPIDYADSVTNLDSRVHYHRNVNIYMINSEGRDEVKFILHNAWPVKVDYSDLDSMASKVLLERLELAVGGVTKYSNMY